MLHMHAASADALHAGMCRMEAASEAVEFGPDGSSYALLTGNRLILHNCPGDDAPLATFSHPSRVLCLSHVAHDLIATGAEDGSLRCAQKNLHSLLAIHNHD